MKTADDYRNVNKGNYDRQFKRMEPINVKPGGANIFAAVLLIVAIAVIGVLVWRMNAMSNELKTVQDNSDEVVRLKGQVSSLSQQAGEKDAEVDRLNDKVKELEDENIRLADLAREADEPTPEDVTPVPESSPASNGLDNGYYTVKSGDTLWNISQQFLGRGEDYLKIAAANGIDASQPLIAGLRLKIPTQ